MVSMTTIITIIIIQLVASIPPTYQMTSIMVNRNSSGDVFASVPNWKGTCAQLDGTKTTYYIRKVLNSTHTTYYSRRACMCQLNNHGQIYNGSFYRSRKSGMYKCYYGVGELAEGSLTLENNKSCKLRNSQIPSLAENEKKSILENDIKISTEKLSIQNVYHLTYNSTQPWVSVANPFTLVSDNQQSAIQTAASTLKTWRLRWARSNKGFSYSTYVGHLLRIVMRSTDSTGTAYTAKHVLILRVPGERTYKADIDTKDLPTPTTSTSTTTDKFSICMADATCKRYHDLWVNKTAKYNSLKTQYDQLLQTVQTSTTVAPPTTAEMCQTIYIGFGAACGVLLIIIIILLLCMCKCCRIECCIKDEKPKESVIISSPSPVFIPPRRGGDKADKPPPTPERTHHAPYKHTFGGKPESLYESIHRPNQTYELATNRKPNSPYMFDNGSLNPDEGAYIEPIQEGAYVEPIQEEAYVEPYAEYVEPI